MNHPECAKWQERSSRVLAGGPATLSKLPSRYPIPIAPSILTHGDGAYVWCPDGHSYVDVVSALGPVILGHNDPAVTLAVMEQAGKLASSTLSTMLETEVAEMLCAMVPGAEMCRFATNGRDVTESAIKLARHMTGKRHVVYCGYAGGFPDYLITTDKHGGVLPCLAPYNHQVAWRDFDALDCVLEGSSAIPAKDDLAAIILEVPPEAPDMGRDDTTWALECYRDAAHASGALFILDEIVTGLRYGLAGAQGYYGIQADLITMSKALGNGYPIAAILGPCNLMRGFDGGSVFLSTTFGANPLGLAAAKATLLELQKPRVLAQFRKQGEALRLAFATALEGWKIPITMRGNFARMVFDFRNVDGVGTAEEIRTLWLQEWAKHGVLAGLPWLPMTCWNDTIVHEIAHALPHVVTTIVGSIESGKPIGEMIEVPVIRDMFQRYEAPQSPW